MCNNPRQMKSGCVTGEVVISNFICMSTWNGEEQVLSFSPHTLCKCRISAAEEQSQDGLCVLCENPADVKFEPCGHIIMCSVCADRAKRCPVCKVKASWDHDWLLTALLGQRRTCS